MAKKKPKSSASVTAVAPATPTGETQTRVVAPKAIPVGALPTEMGKGDWTAILLALMMFFTPAVGVPHEYMLQDTLKSIVVACVAFFTLGIFFYRQRNRRDGLRWHFTMWLFLSLAAWAVGSMVWSHTYLAGVEASRWIVLSVIVFLSLNAFTRERVPLLASGVHFGAVAATVWAAAQFWGDWKGIPQGPPPASTFVNRNFYAEFVACTIPFGFYLLLTARKSAAVFVFSLTNAFVLVGIMMTGTRSAMIATGVGLILVGIAAYRYRKQLAFSGWSSGKKIMSITLIAITMGLLGLIPSKAKGFEYDGINAWQRAFFRASLLAKPTEYTSGSASVRKVMWLATARIIQQRPITGVGAGAWEVDIPLYQDPGSQLETDYYVHNEFLQLLAEYGIVGWFFLLSLLSYLSIAAIRTLRGKSAEEKAEAPLRIFILITLTAFFLVSNAGFPWRMASTGAMFALAVGALGASDARLGYRSIFAAVRMNWSPTLSQLGVSAAAVCMAVTLYITYYAAESERLIVLATKNALSITASGEPNNPKFDRVKKEVFKTIREGIDINPHYRKVTPMVADEAAKWGNWKEATWIWESVLGSRPYVVAIMANVARGYVVTGEPEKSLVYIERAKKIQPAVPSIWGAEINALVRMGKIPEAIAKSKEALKRDIVDTDVLNISIQAAISAKDWPFAIEALEAKKKHLPASVAESDAKIAQIYVAGLGDEKSGMKFYKSAVEAMPTPQERLNFLSSLPPQFIMKIGADYTALGIPPDVVARLTALRVQPAVAAPAAAAKPVAPAQSPPSGGFVPQPAKP